MANVESIVSGMAGRYALALHELAAEKGVAAQVGAALDGFKTLMDNSGDLRRLVRSPAFSAEEQGRALGAVLDKAGIAGLAADFLKLLASKRRLFAVSDVISAYGALQDAAEGVTRAQAVVAAPLSDAQANALRDQIAAAAGAKKVEVDVKVDPSILGGLVVRLGSNMVDTSIRTKLNAIRTRMKEVG